MIKREWILMPMKLQFFGNEDGGNGDGAGDGDSVNGGGTGAEGAEGGEAGDGDKPQSFDDFLTNSENQAEFDRRVDKAIQTAVTKAQEKWQALTDDKLSEAEKLARMTKDEKSQYMQQKREKELTERETAITRKELMAESKNTLADKGLPVELAEILDYANADTCKSSIEKVESAFQQALEKAVEEKLKGGNPPKKPNETNSLDDQIYKAMSGGL